MGYLRAYSDRAKLEAKVNNDHRQGRTIVEKKQQRKISLSRPLSPGVNGPNFNFTKTEM